MSVVSGCGFVDSVGILMWVGWVVTSSRILMSGFLASSMTVAAPTKQTKNKKEKWLLLLLLVAGLPLPLPLHHRRGFSTAATGQTPDCTTSSAG